MPAFKQLMYLIDFKRMTSEIPTAILSRDYYLTSDNSYIS